MTKTKTIEVPVVGGAPLPEKKMGMLRFLLSLRRITNEEGGLVPLTMAATVLGMSKQRVHDLVKEGTLRAIEFGGKKWLSGKELESFVQLERKAGRPWKEPSKKEMWRASMDTARNEIVGR
jgi:hypothetical protein